MKREYRIIVAALFTALGVWAAWQAAAFPLTGRLMPMLAASGLALFSGLQLLKLLVQQVRQRSVAEVVSGDDGRDLPEGATMALGEGHMRDLPSAKAAFGRYLFGWFLASLAGIGLLGTWVGGFIFLAAFVWVELPEQRSFAGLLITATLGVAGLLVALLGIDVPTGLLLQSLR